MFGANYLSDKMGASETARDGLGGVAGAVGSAIPEITGIASTPGEKAKKFMSAAYPGTTPWERLGANAGGAVGSAATSGKIQERMQSKELETRERVADKNARSSLIAAAAPIGRGAVSSSLSAYNRQGAVDYDTSVKQGRERLPGELKKLDAETKSRLAEVPLKNAQAEGQGIDNYIREVLKDYREILARNQAQDKVPSVLRAIDQINDQVSKTSGDRKKMREEFYKGVTGEAREILDYIFSQLDRGKSNQGKVFTDRIKQPYDVDTTKKRWDTRRRQMKGK